MTEISIPNLPADTRWAIVRPGDTLILTVEISAFESHEALLTFYRQIESHLPNVDLVMIDSVTGLAVLQGEPK